MEVVPSAVASPGMNAKGLLLIVFARFLISLSSSVSALDGERGRQFRKRYQIHTEGLLCARVCRLSSGQTCDARPSGVQQLSNISFWQG
jgi:hypothetical protein